MTDKRVSQAPLEVLYQGTPDARVSQASLETMYTGTPTMRVSQTTLEVMYVPGAAPAATPRFSVIWVGY